MKKSSIIIYALAFTLMASVLLNAWLIRKSANCQHIPIEKQIWDSHKLSPEKYPVKGLTRDELKNMMDEIDKDEKRTDFINILAVDVIDRNRVKITTGQMNAPLSGGGRIFYFYRNKNGWELDKTSLSAWVS